MLGDLDIHTKINVGLDFLRNFLPPQPSDRLIQQFRIQFNSHRIHQSVLLGTQQVPRTPNFQVHRRNAKTRTQLTEFLDCSQTLSGILAQHFLGWDH